MEINNLFRIKQQFVARNVGNELVIVPLSANVAQMNELFTLNETAKFLWESIEANSTVSSLSARLIADFDIDIETATKDVEAFLVKMDILKKYSN